MTIRPLIVLAIVPVLTFTAAARAQAPGQEPPPCVKNFIELRSDVEKKGQAIQAANKRRASPKEACGLFNSLVRSEDKMIKYALENNVWCGIPAQAIEQMKAGHAKLLEVRGKVCQAAAQPARPAGPTLGDALGTTPVPSTDNVKSGRGTFDTLTGTPLGR